MTRQIIYSNVFALLLASTGCQLIADFKDQGTDAAGADAGGKSNKGGAANQGGVVDTSKGGGTNATSGGVGGVANMSGGKSNGTAGGANSSGGTTSTSGGASTSDGGTGNTNVGGTSPGTSGGATQSTVGGTTSTSGGTSGNGGGTTTNGGTAGTGNVTATGGKAQGGGVGQTGGATSVGGAATGGVVSTGGKAYVGGASTGGVTTAATGGASTGGVATGGAATGGVATGGVATGGAATGGTSPINQFVSGPCIATSDQANVEVFANGGDQHIYRRVIGGGNNGAWASVAGLNAGLLNILSDLDCSGNATAMHIAASGASPLNSYWHAVGFGTVFNQFVRELSTNSPATFGVGVSISAAPIDNWYDMAAVYAGQVTWVDQRNGTAPTVLSPPVAYLASAPDVVVHLPTNATHLELVAYDNTGSLVYFDQGASIGGTSWLTPVYVLPPSSRTYSFSPTLCSQTDTKNASYRRHIAGVAGGTLYHAETEGGWGTTTFSSWEPVSNVLPGSSPDCVVTADGSVHIVFLTSAGTIAYVHGTTGSWTTTDLGGH